MASYTSSIVVIVLLVAVIVEMVASATKFVPPGMNADMFPEPSYDLDAPECTPMKEPCGFYSFSLTSHSPFKWVKSWCQCGSNYDCVFEKADMKMRVYRQVCMPRTGRKEDENRIL
uniref:Secreted protein n=1 Tax=Panagrellus redivivus TaxID=6233 RepID=A0A7E4W839_PANRE